ncbi:conjugal transfer protein TraN [Vibrio harveyi]|nr:conjugal transfer protein TraN [Vibrio harveyi]
MTCDVGYTLSGAQCIKNTFSWKTDCSLLKDCKKTNQVCIEGPQTRIINGIPTHLDCWKYQVNHLCELSDSCASLPKDCKEQSRSCSLKQNGVCVEEEIKKVALKNHAAPPKCSAVNNPFALMAIAMYQSQNSMATLINPLRHWQGLPKR